VEQLVYNHMAEPIMSPAVPPDSGRAVPVSAVTCQSGTVVCHAPTGGFCILACCN
jgi:hypothetical protein